MFNLSLSLSAPRALRRFWMPRARSMSAATRMRPDGARALRQRRVR